MELKVTSHAQALKATKLIAFAANIGMDLRETFGVVYNGKLEGTYFWHNDYKFELLISDFSDDIAASWYDGRLDREVVCTEDTTLDELIECFDC